MHSPFRQRIAALTLLPLTILLTLSQASAQISTQPASEQSVPHIRLCSDLACRQAVLITPGRESWNHVLSLYKNSLLDESEELDSLPASIQTLELDIYQQLSQQDSLGRSAQTMYSDNSEKLNYKNLKRIIAVLLDEHLVTHHYLRNTQTLTNWRGQQQIQGLMIQSIQNGKRYLIRKNTAILNAAVTIIPYQPGAPVLQINTSPASNDEESSD